MTQTHTASEASAAGRYGKDQRYYDLLSYIVSNAVAGELMAVDNYTEMTPLLGSTDEKLETVEQAHDEAKHVRVLAKLGRRLGFGVQQRIVEPQWLKIREHFSDAVQARDLAGCLIIQDLMVETMAIVLYRTLGRNTDPETARFAGNILEDEVRHLQIGMDRIKRLMDDDEQAVVGSLRSAHHNVMPELFSMISYSCQSLCSELDVKCSTLGLDSLGTDLDAIRVDALDTYLDMLDRAGFDTAVTTPLVASMAGYGDMPRGEMELRFDCCSAPAR